MDSVVDTFADTVLELPPRDQDHLLRCRVSRVTCLTVTCHVSTQCQGAPGGRNDGPGDCKPLPAQQPPEPSTEAADGPGMMIMMMIVIMIMIVMMMEMLMMLGR